MRRLWERSLCQRFKKVSQMQHEKAEEDKQAAQGQERVLLSEVEERHFSKPEKKEGMNDRHTERVRAR